MKIISLVLNGYRGFRLRLIDHFEYRPTEKTQVVLGTNGSGKSSLLRELSPLPANHTDYAKGGKKEITIQHEGKLYFLQSLFTPEGPRYYFNVDGENQNPGLTVTVFKELVKQHFNYTPEVHAIMTGQVKFHSMSVADRRKWFTAISETDYTYAIKYFQRVKERVTYLQNGLKLTQTRLVHETEKCLTEKGEQELREKIVYLTNILNTLLDHRKPKISYLDQQQRRISQLDTQLESDLTRLERLLAENGTYDSPETLEGLQRASIASQVTMTMCQREITEHCKRLDALNKDYEAVSKTGTASIDDTKTIIKELEEEQDELLGHLRYSIRYDDPSSTLSAFESIRSSLEDIYACLSSCPRLDYTRADYQQLLESSQGYQQALLKAKLVEDRCFAERKLHEASLSKGEVNCPKCDHRWVPNYSEAHHAKIVREHELAMTISKEAEAQKAKNEQLIEEHRYFFGLLDRYRELTRHFGALAPYWDWISSNRKLTTTPDGLNAMLHGVFTDIQAQVKLSLLNKSISEKKALLVLMENAKDLDKGKLEKQIEDQNNLLLKAQGASRVAFGELELCKTRIRCIQQIEEFNKRVQDALAERDEALRLLIEDSCVSALDEIIRSVKLSVSQYERTISQIENQKAIVESLKKQAVEIEGELKLMKMAQKSLSPSEGLIAKGMTGFINHFVKQVNHFIAKIWLYPLEIQPVKSSEEDGVDLNYRFAVLVNNDLPVNDVSLCSAGMQEVIDLAYVAISMRYLGLTNFPIFLDEFAAKMDPAHRQSAYQIIEHLINSAEYSQVFLVSHYQDGYSSLTASEILVLCDSNVQMPSHLVYNQHATLN